MIDSLDFLFGHVCRRPPFCCGFCCPKERRRRGGGRRNCKSCFGLLRVPRGSRRGSWALLRSSTTSSLMSATTQGLTPSASNHQVPVYQSPHLSQTVFSSHYSQSHLDPPGASPHASFPLWSSQESVVAQLSPEVDPSLSQELSVLSPPSEPTPL